MSTILSLLIIGLVFYITYELFQILRFRKQPEKYKPHVKRTYIALGIFVVLVLVLSFTSGDKKDTKKNNSQRTEKKANKKSTKKDTAKEKADKKEAKEVADARKKNMANNLEEYKKDLEDVPNKTNGLISKAYISPENGETIVVLSDDTLQPGDSQMEEVAHSAWNAIHSMGDNYKLSENENTHANLIEIQDQAGDTIATTSFMGNFKYKGIK